MNRLGQTLGIPIVDQLLTEQPKPENEKTDEKILQLAQERKALLNHKIEFIQHYPQFQRLDEVLEAIEQISKATDNLTQERNALLKQLKETQPQHYNEYIALKRKVATIDEDLLRLFIRSATFGQNNPLFTLAQQDYRTFNNQGHTDSASEMQEKNLAIKLFDHGISTADRILQKREQFSKSNQSSNNPVSI